MGRFVARRLVEMVLSLAVAVTLLFVAFTVLPGDPIRGLFPSRPPPPELYERLQVEYRLDQPLFSQYLYYVADLLRGDLGESFPIDPWGRPDSGVPVSSIVTAAAPVSARLLVAALVVQVVVGLVAGVLAGWGRGRWIGRGLYAVALLAVATPVLVTAYVARTVVGQELRWLPATGVTAGWQGYVLPTLALAALSTGLVVLLTRAEVDASLRAPYVRAARGRGLPGRRVVGVHALRPAVLPVTTFLAANAGQLFVALVVVEGVFRVPGLGGVLYDALGARDRGVVIGVVTVIMVVVVVANAVGDVVAALLDPRVRETVTR